LSKGDKMGYKNFDLLNDVVTVYDQNKTTIAGRVSQKTIGGVECLGPSVPNWADIFTDTGIIPTGAMYMSKNITADTVRIFAVATPVLGSLQIILYNQNIKTGAYMYVGRLTLRSPNIATTTIVKGIEVLDSGTTGWKIYLAMNNTILINGGLTLMNKVDLTDFTPLGAIFIDPATGNDQKAAYLLQDPANIGVNQLNVASTGIIVDEAAAKVYIHNGIAATHQYYVYDTAIAPTFLEAAVTITNANPGVISQAGHSFLANGPVLFKTTGTVSGLTTNTVYFIKNPIAGVSYELSATSGGASISTVGTQTGTHTIGRAFGTTGSNFVLKTGNLPALIGTLLTNNYEVLANPTHASYGGLVGNNCSAFGTSTNLYMGKLSELTSGVTIWPSLTTANVLGALNEVTAVTPIATHFSNVLDMFVIFTNTSVYFGKRLVNNEIQFKGGRVNNTYYELTIPAYGDVKFGSAAIAGATIANGIVTLIGSTIGQRGMISFDMGSDERFDRDYIVTKVLDTPDSILQTISVIDKLVNNADNYSIQYRNSGFGSITGGWVDFDESTLAAIPLSAQIQLKLGTYCLTAPNQTASQLVDVVANTESNEDISDNWEYSHDSSSNLSPTRVAFRLKTAYGVGSIPAGLRFRSYDLSGSLLINQTIATNPANFEYSTNNGSTWLPLGTIPNTVGTLVRYTFTSPPGVDIRPALRDS
jgi:hypothetical protein